MMNDLMIIMVIQVVIVMVMTVMNDGDDVDDDYNWVMMMNYCDDNVDDLHGNDGGDDGDE